MGRDEGWGMYGWGIGLMHEEWENSETCDEIQGCGGGMGEWMKAESIGVREDEGPMGYGLWVMKFGVIEGGDE